MRKRLWQERVRTFRVYWKPPQFLFLDLLFGFIALWTNPYRTCRKFLEKKGEKDVYVYGETPYSTYERIVEQCGIGPEDTWFEMGSGRGKGCFWLSYFVKCRVVGIEWVPQFVVIARWIKRLFRIKQIDFQCVDFERADLAQATVIYLYGHHPHLPFPRQCKIISISQPLEGLPVLKAFWVRYPWGRTTAFLQKIA